MNIYYATYYDHIERTGYDPVRIVENWNSCERRLVFVSSKEEKKVCNNLKLDAEIIILGKSIEKPNDIPIAQNMCIEKCLEMGADVIVYTQGDTYITKSGDRFIYNYITHETGVIFGHIMTMAVMLYSNMWMHTTTVVSSKEMPVVYGHAGTNINKNNVLTTKRDKVLDLGYLSTEMYYKKMRGHNYIWPDVYKTNWMKLWDSGQKEEAVRLAYKVLAESKQVPIEPIDIQLYYELINKMNLLEDYKFCDVIIKDILK